MKSLITHAVQVLKVFHPDYFEPRHGRKRVLREPIERPSLRTTSVFDGVPLLEILTPPGILKYDVDTWRGWFDEVAVENLRSPRKEIRLLCEDLADRVFLNTRQRAWFFPSSLFQSVQYINIPLNFCLQGAMLAGATVTKMDQYSFVLTKDGDEWGIYNSKVINHNHKLYPMNYYNVSRGKVGRGAWCANDNLVRAYLSAVQARDAVAKEVVTAAYWNIPETRRLNALFSL